MLLSEHPSSPDDPVWTPVAHRPVLPGLSTPRQRHDPGGAQGLLRMWPYLIEGSELERHDLLGLPAIGAGVGDHPVLRAVSADVAEARGLREVERGRPTDATEGASDGGWLPSNRRAGIRNEPARQAAAVPDGGRSRGTLRDCTPSTGRRAGEDTVRPSWRHGEGGRDDHPAARPRPRYGRNGRK